MEEQNIGIGDLVVIIDPNGAYPKDFNNKIAVIKDYQLAGQVGNQFKCKIIFYLKGKIFNDFYFLKKDIRKLEEGELIKITGVNTKFKIGDKFSFPYDWDFETYQYKSTKLIECLKTPKIVTKLEWTKNRIKYLSERINDKTKINNYDINDELDELLEVFKTLERINARDNLKRDKPDH